MRRSRPAVLLLALLASCGQPDDPASSNPDVPDAASCVDDRTFFREQLWPEVLHPTCMACHTAEGAARESDLVFSSTARPDHLDVDAAMLAEIAGLEREGTSILLLKPQGQEGHGGGAVVEEGSEALRLLQEFVTRAASPVTCPDSDMELAEPEGLVLLSPAETLRKAALLLVGRLPTPDELANVRSGGEPALRVALRDMLGELAFPERMTELFNDLLLTDRYLLSRDGLGLLEEEDFPNKMWFEDTYADGVYDLFYTRSSQAVAKEPLEIIGHVLRERRPWTEVVSGDYTVVNDYSAMVYNAPGAYEPDADDPGALLFHEAKIEGWPHAGVLSTPAFYNRFPTTATNRNRHRAWKVFKTFLGTDILAFAERPIDPTISEVHNPTMNDPQCAVCHATMDPVAGLFQDFDDEGRYNPPEAGWYADMRPPGYGDEVLPGGYEGRSIQWLGQKVASDPRFALAAVQTVLTLIADVELLDAARAGDDPDRIEALEAQDAFVDRTAARFREGGYELRDVVEAVVMSRYFRATASEGAPASALIQAGTAHVLTPEQLSRKIRATTGLPWKERWSDTLERLHDEYKLLYGGIDSFGVTERLQEMNGVMSSISLRMATEVTCSTTAHDFALPSAQRRLFPFVEPSFEPETPEGFPVPDAEAKIRENLRWLHYRLLGEELAANDPELDVTYQLWHAAWQDARSGVIAATLDDDLPSACRATEDPFTGADLPEASRVYKDANGTIRAWMAVMTYLLSDARYLYE